jgi:FkbM family methyltransferase
MNPRLLYRRLRWALRRALGRDVRFAVQARVPAERHGSEYGGWWVCPDGLDRGAIVYSAGVGTDITFDRSLIEKYGLAVHAFDPTPASIEFLRAQSLPAGYAWQPVGLAGRDGHATFYAPSNPDHVSHSMVAPGVSGRSIDVSVRRLATIMRELGHTRIDVLKLDIEGAEYDVLDDVVASRLAIGQILVEFHHRLPGVGVERTRRAVSALNGAGYRIFHSSESGEEVSFIRTGQAERPRE